MESYTPELLQILKQAGCYPLRTGKGDHSIWFSPVNEPPFVVYSKIKSRHTANAVLKQAGLPTVFGSKP